MWVPKMSRPSEYSIGALSWDFFASDPLHYLRSHAEKASSQPLVGLRLPRAPQTSRAARPLGQIRRLQGNRALGTPSRGRNPSPPVQTPFSQPSRSSTSRRSEPPSRAPEMEGVQRDARDAAGLAPAPRGEALDLPASRTRTAASRRGDHCPGAPPRAGEPVGCQNPIHSLSWCFARPDPGWPTPVGGGKAIGRACLRSLCAGPTRAHACDAQVPEPCLQGPRDRGAPPRTGHLASTGRSASAD